VFSLTPNGKGGFWEGREGGQDGRPEMHSQGRREKSTITNTMSSSQPAWWKMP